MFLSPIVTSDEEVTSNSTRSRSNTNRPRRRSTLHERSGRARVAKKKADDFLPPVDLPVAIDENGLRHYHPSASDLLRQNQDYQGIHWPVGQPFTSTNKSTQEGCSGDLRSEQITAELSSRKYSISGSQSRLFHAPPRTVQVSRHLEKEQSIYSLDCQSTTSMSAVQGSFMSDSFTSESFMSGTESDYSIGDQHYPLQSTMHPQSHTRHIYSSHPARSRDWTHSYHDDYSSMRMDQSSMRMDAYQGHSSHARPESPRWLEHPSLRPQTKMERLTAIQSYLKSFEKSTLGQYMSSIESGYSSSDPYLPVVPANSTGSSLDPAQLTDVTGDESWSSSYSETDSEGEDFSGDFTDGYSTGMSSRFYAVPNEQSVLSVSHRPQCDGREQEVRPFALYRTGPQDGCSPGGLQRMAQLAPRFLPPPPRSPIYETIDEENIAPMPPPRTFSNQQGRHNHTMMSAASDATDFMDKPICRQPVTKKVHSDRRRIIAKSLKRVGQQLKKMGRKNPSEKQGLRTLALL